MRKAVVVCITICSMLLASCGGSQKVTVLEKRVAGLESEIQECNQTVEEAYEDCRSVVAAYEEKLAKYEERLAKTEGLPLYWYGVHESGFTPSGNDCVKVIADVVPWQSGAMTDEEMLEIANHIIGSIVLEREVNAICLFFWASENSRERGEYARGCVDWGPSGEFYKAENVETGDYSQHSYRVVFNRTTESIALRSRFLLDSTRKKIFYDLVRLQDQISIWDSRYQDKQQRAKEDIAKQYGISMSELSSIIEKGARQGWPMPEPPPGGN